MNPHTGETTPVDLNLLRLDPEAERERAASEVGLDDPDDLVVIEGKRDHVGRLASAVAAKAKVERRAANKRARAQRKRNRQ